MTAPRVAVLYLGRPSASGEWRRVVTWRGLLESAGAEVTAIPLLHDHAARRLPPRAGDLARLSAGHVVPEVFAWSPRSAGSALDRLRPAAVIFVTARAYHPSLVDRADVAVLDFVDSLGRSYRDRAALQTGWFRHGFALLGRAHTRFESRAVPGVLRVASGWRDAHDLGAQWVPGHIPPPPVQRPRNPHRDVLFFGNLGYPPNVEAVRRLSRIWPEVRHRRPAATALVAGANPTSEVRALARNHHWDLIADFGDLQDVCDGCRLAVAPLDHTAGIQTKVLEAAMMGIAQVVTPPALEGMAPGFPVTVAADDGALVRGICELLDDPVRRAAEADAAQAHVRQNYSLDSWGPWASRLLETAGTVVGQPLAS